MFEKLYERYQDARHLNLFNLKSHSNIYTARLLPFSLCLLNALCIATITNSSFTFNRATIFFKANFQYYISVNVHAIFC